MTTVVVVAVCLRDCCSGPLLCGFVFVVVVAVIVGLCVYCRGSCCCRLSSRV